jgi:hypothetical protein
MESIKVLLNQRRENGYQCLLLNVEIIHINVDNESTYSVRESLLVITTAYL